TPDSRSNTPAPRRPPESISSPSSWPSPSARGCPSTRPRSRPGMRSSCGSTPRVPDAASWPPRSASMASTSPAAPDAAGTTASGGPWVRRGSGRRGGDLVPAAFDSLFAKLIVSGPDRQPAIARTVAAAKELHVEGPATVLPCSLEILSDEAFTGLGADDVEGIHTQWIETELLPRLEEQKRPAPIAEEELQRLPIELDGKLTTIGLPARLLTALGAAAGAGASGAAASASGEGRESAGGGEDAGAVTAPVPGSLVDYLVDDGAEVEAGDEVAVVSAMKM